jgi:hypothetical protein
MFSKIFQIIFTKYSYSFYSFSNWDQINMFNLFIFYNMFFEILLIIVFH